MPRRRRRKRRIAEDSSTRPASLTPSTKAWASSTVFRRAGLTSAIAVIAGGAVLGGFHVLEQRVLADPRFLEPAHIVFKGDAAQSLRDVLLEHLGDLVEEPWASPDLCRRIGTRLRENGWVKDIRSVARRADGRLEIDCDYRRPLAVVQDGGNFVLAADDGVRLPGRYGSRADLPVIQGACSSMPWVGGTFTAGDVAAGLELVRRLRGEPYRRQIVAVRVDNFDGRIDPTAAHLELATDRMGGRILWGSAPGREVEENTVDQKLALLRYNFKTSGRADANFHVIDISTFPDRFIVPEGS